MDGVGRKPAPAESSKLREISGDELQQIRTAHETWLQTDENEGEQADLSHAYLQGADLSGAKHVVHIDKMNAGGDVVDQSHVDYAVVT